MADGNVLCGVILPNSVDSLVREFSSAGFWATERRARLDAAFAVYFGLYRIDLTNINLLPLPCHDEEAVKAYAEVAKKPAVILVNEKFHPWPAVAAAWQSTCSLYGTAITILSRNTGVMRMKMISPCRLPQVFDLTLYVNAKI